MQHDNLCILTIMHDNFDFISNCDIYVTLWTNDKLSLVSFLSEFSRLETRRYYYVIETGTTQS